MERALAAAVVIAIIAVVAMLLGRWCSRRAYYDYSQNPRLWFVLGALTLGLASYIQPWIATIRDAREAGPAMDAEREWQREAERNRRHS